MKTTVAACLLVASSAAFAQQVIDFDADFAPSKTRAQVRSEVLAARADGTLDRFGEATRVSPGVQAVHAITPAEARAAHRALHAARPFERDAYIGG